MLFREQGITIASILTAVGMAIDVLVEALLPGGGIVAVEGKWGHKNGSGTNSKPWRGYR